MKALERRTFAEELAIEAGFLALSYRNQDDLDVRAKGTLDWVTNADLATEQLIRSRIAEVFPNDHVVGEEGVKDSRDHASAGSTWVIDPIDGTTSFVTGLPSWCVSIACLDEKGHPFLGIIRDPTGAETFSALEHHGIAINGVRISVPSMGVHDGLVGVGHPRNISPEPTIAFLGGLLATGGLFYNCGSAALALAYVAVGRLVGFYESDLRAWDALAGEVLVRESGGWSTAFMRDRSLETSKPVLAANRGTASALWDIASEHLTDCQPPDHNRHL